MPMDVSIVQENGERLLPSVYKLKTTGRGSERYTSVIELISQTMGNVCTNLLIKKPTPGQYSLDQIMEATKALSSEQFQQLKGNIEVKPLSARSVFDAAFMR
eukprot:7531241-Karenia_brevis.AAC.1